MEKLTSENDLYRQFIGKWCEFTRMGDNPTNGEMNYFGIVNEIQPIQNRFYQVRCSDFCAYGHLDGYFECSYSSKKTFHFDITKFQTNARDVIKILTTEQVETLINKYKSYCENSNKFLQHTLIISTK